MISSRWDSLTSRTSSETLCANLALGIHAAAQPLAVLQASLSREHTDRMTDRELRQLAASSALEVQRVCRLFNCLQELVMAESEPQLCSTPILPLLADAVDGVGLLFQDDRIALVVKLPDTTPPVLIHPARTLHAVSRVLLVAHALSSERDTVELVASQSPHAVHIAVRNADSVARAMKAEVSLSLAIAAANIRSQQAAFSHCLRPFEVHIELTQSQPAREL